MRRGVFLSIVVTGLLAQILPADTIYYNQAAWQTAMSASSLASISFASSQWSNSLQLTNTTTTLVSQSTTAASNGMSVSVDSGFSKPGYAADSTLGHVSNGSFVDSISKYGSTTFNFSSSIHGFGGNFDIASSNGLFIANAGDVADTSGLGPFSGPGYNGFIGVVSNRPMDSIFISWGDSLGGCPCYGNSYTLTNFEVGGLSNPTPNVVTIATPEPDYKYAFVGMALLVICYRFSRRS